MNVEFINILSVVVTAVLVPVIGVLTWSIKKFVNASIDHTTKLIEQLNRLDDSIESVREELTDKIDTKCDKLELHLEALSQRIK